MKAGKIKAGALRVPNKQLQGGRNQCIHMWPTLWRAIVGPGVSTKLIWGLNSENFSFGQPRLSESTLVPKAMLKVSFLHKVFVTN